MNGKIYRIFTALFAIFWGFTAFNGLTCIVGCVAVPRAEELFFYRSESIEAEIELECNGAASRFTYSGTGDSSRVEFLSPEELRGFALEVSPNGGKVSFDGLETDAPEALCAVPNIMRAVFTLSPEDITAVETAPHPEKTGESVTVVTAGEITVTLDGNGLPLSAAGVAFGVQFKAKILKLAVNPQETGDTVNSTVDGIA